MAVPKTIGRYEVVRLLGSGAMGFVYLARDPELDRSVAVKTLRDLKLSDDAFKTFLDRFRNEARAAARLHHPAIVQVYDVGEDEEVGPFVVFEHVPGSSLRQVLRDRGPLSPSEVVLLAEHVGDAIDLAHQEGIIHRDIKPDNLLVTDQGRSKLADFGVARVPNAALTREGQFLGTPCYSAPETLAEGAYSPQSDIFSFAALLYEAASGARAFPGDDAVAVAHKVIHDEPTPVSEVARGGAVPDSVSAVIMVGLSKTPSERPDTALAFATKLREAYEAAGLLNDRAREPSTRFSPTIPGPTRSSRGFGWMVAGLVLLGVGMVFFFSRSTEPQAPLDPGRGLEESDGGATDAEAAEIAGQDATSPDAGGPPGEDAGTDAGSAEVASPTIPGSLREDPEERAKVALAEADTALARGDIEAAAHLLEEARRLDPGNDDIDGLARRIAGARP